MASQPPARASNPIHAWRIVETKHAATAFSGQGAKRFGGRWNSKGVAMVYTAASTSLAMLEMLVHLELEDLRNEYVLFEATFDSSLVSEVDLVRLPKGWQTWPSPAALREVGDGWVAGVKSPVLRVPSAVVATEFNYLLNPGHEDFGMISIGPVREMAFDPRLAKKLTP